MNNKSDIIMIFASSEPEVQTHEVRRGVSEAVKSVAHKFSEVAVSTMKDNVRRFLKNLDIILKSSPKDVGGLTLDEVEIQVQIDGKGNVGISGIAEAELAAQGGIKFVLRKKM